MDLPAVQVEVWRLCLQGQPPEEVCRPQPSSGSLASSVSGSDLCRQEAQRIRIDQPAGWPVLPPPPVPTLD